MGDNTDSTARAAALQTDGKIVVALNQPNSDGTNTQRTDNMGSFARLQ
jgi:hypothetical protein